MYRSLILSGILLKRQKLLNSIITDIKGIGPKKAKILEIEASIKTVEDLIYYTPRKYLDRSTCKPIKDCRVNEIVTVSGTIINLKIILTVIIPITAVSVATVPNIGRSK